MPSTVIKRLTFALFCSLSLFTLGCGGSENTVEDALFFLDPNGGQPARPAPVLSYRVVNTFPHQTDAFTQGLLYDNGFLYEGTGLLGRSSLREVELTTGAVVRRQDLANDVFGEGIALLSGEIVQLTLNSGLAVVWDKNSFSTLGGVSIPNPSWGITAIDETTFAHSDGTSTVRFFANDASFSQVRRITVTDNGVEVDRLNELEFVKGLIYANRFPTDEIVAIDPDTGVIAFRIDLGGIIDKNAYNLGPEDIPNGIAFDAEQNRLFVTGKRWPFLYQIELVQ